jgi:hypothetical protein
MPRSHCGTAYGKIENNHNRGTSVAVKVRLQWTRLLQHFVASNLCWLFDTTVGSVKVLPDLSAFGTRAMSVWRSHDVLRVAAAVGG